MLIKYLKPQRNKGGEKDDELLGEQKPLSTFAARIAVAFRLGLISEDDAEAFTHLRKIRNDCAHNIFQLDLTKPPHSNRVKEFLTLSTKDPSRAFAVDGMEGLVTRPNNDEERFIYCCLAHAVYLHETTTRVTQCPDGFTTDFFRPTQAPHLRQEQGS